MLVSLEKNLFQIWLPKKLIFDDFSLNEDKTIEGLITSYTLAIPFFKNTIISTCLFTALLTISINYIEAVNEKINYFIFKFFSKSKSIRK